MNGKIDFLRYPTLEEYRNRSPKDGRLIGGKREPAERRVAVRGLVSVITVCFNSAATLERTIRSVVEQRYPHVEYLVIDGGSSDGTLEVLRKWDEHIAFWVSESDEGISDAFNKGIAAATGEFAMLVSADDWLEPNYLARAIAALSACDADYVFGNILMHASDGRVAGILAGDAAYADHLARFRMPNINHPTFVYRRTAFARYGLFNTSLRQSMDYEWALRVVARGGQGRHCPELTSHVGLGGVSDRAFARSLAEVREVWIAYGCPVPIAWVQFTARLLKGHARRFFERLLPQSAFMRLRRAINRGFGEVGDTPEASVVAEQAYRNQPHDSIARKAKQELKKKLDARLDS